MDESTSTLVMETVVVSMAVAVGAVYTADAWPSPDLPLIWMGGAAGLFVIYAVVAAVRDVRKLKRSQAAPEPETAQPQQVSEPAASDTSTPSLVLGAPSEEATEFHSVEQLRAETEDDNTYTEVPSVPLFAESSMYSAAELAAGAREIADEQKQQAQPAQASGAPAAEHEEGA